MIVKLIVIFYLLTCLFIYSIFAELIRQDADVKKDNIEGIMNFVMFILSLVWLIALPIWLIGNKIKGESV